MAEIDPSWKSSEIDPSWKSSKTNAMESFSSALDKVKAHYKFEFALKDEQKEIIKSLVIERKDVFGMLPTGFGKSLTYIMVPLILDELQPDIKHMAIVVSPLKALMKDQVSFLTDHSIKAAAITKEASVEDIKEMSAAGISVLFTSPESAILPKWRQLWKAFQKLTCVLVFDEAHCISSWGQDFRPTYREVTVLQSFFEVPNLIVTATATKQIQEDVYSVLSFDANKTKVVSALPDRPNIFLEVKESSENFEAELSWLLEILSIGPQTKKFIIFVKSINQCYNVYLWIMTKLMDEGFAGEHSPENRRVEMFHANTDSESKERIISQFVKPNGKIELLICTVAFGMGVNIPNIDVVIHWGLPSSTLQYWQEVGRCARDGRCGYAICYAYKRSLTKCDDKELRQIMESDCLRYEVLKIFLLDGMDKAKLEDIKTSDVCSNNCDICTCKKCTCCSICHRSCSCQGKIQFPMNHFLCKKS